MLFRSAVTSPTPVAVTSTTPVAVASTTLVAVASPTPVAVDRKTVVAGKSVDLGGRRIIKKKKKTHTHTLSAEVQTTVHVTHTRLSTHAIHIPQ